MEEKGVEAEEAEEVEVDLSLDLIRLQMGCLS